MPYRLTITDQDYRPIQGAVLFYNGSGVQIGRQSIATPGTILIPELVGQAYFIDIVSAGYTTFKAGVDLLSDESTVTLIKADPLALYIAVGALGGLLLTKFLLPKLFNKWFS